MEELLFVIDMELELLKMRILGVLPAVHPKSAKNFRWTGKTTDLVELLYALHEAKCIDNGEMTLKEMEVWVYRLFGIESKDCYRFYVSIRNRKRDSRTAFLDHLKDKLLEKMQRDDRREMQRK